MRKIFHFPSQMAVEFLYTSRFPFCTALKISFTIVFINKFLFFLHRVLNGFCHQVTFTRNRFSFRIFSHVYFFKQGMGILRFSAEHKGFVSENLFLWSCLAKLLPFIHFKQKYSRFWSILVENWKNYQIFFEIFHCIS